MQVNTAHFLRLFPFIVICFVLVFFPLKASAVGQLEYVQDEINNDLESADSVEHDVSFVLPKDSQQITANDVIIISMPYYQNINPPTSLAGNYFGTPVYSVDGTDVKITGIAVLPGNPLKIQGIIVTNPSVRTNFKITISIAENGDENIIKNFATVFPSKGNGLVSITATIAPPLASLVLAGYGAPGSFVTFTESGTIIGTDIANEANGVFSKFFSGIAPTTHHFSFYAVDRQNRVTAPLNIDIFTPIYQQTTVSDLLLSPTIEINATDVIQGQNILVKGATIPQGNLSIFTESPLRTYYATASAEGNWSYTITNTNSYIPGDYRLYSLVQTQGGLQSLFSNALQFTILPSSGPSPSPAACNISSGDLSCDGHVNLSDFSILMYYWGSYSPSADINLDGRVDLTDFSIMMYYWGT